VSGYSGIRGALAVIFSLWQVFNHLHGFSQQRRFDDLQTRIFHKVAQQYDFCFICLPELTKVLEYAIAHYAHHFI